MANFNEAWKFTGEDEGADSSYEQFTKWGVTKGYLEFWKIGKPTDEYIRTMTASKAGDIVRQTIWDKVVQGGKIKDQHLANMLLSFGFNKPKYVIQFSCEVFGLSKEAIKKAIDKFRIPDSVIERMNNDPIGCYGKIWQKWWAWSINSGHFKEGSVNGLAKRIWRYKIYGQINALDRIDGVRAAADQTTNAAMRADLNKYLSKKRKFNVLGKKGAPPLALMTQNNIIVAEAQDDFIKIDEQPDGTLAVKTSGPIWLAVGLGLGFGAGVAGAYFYNKYKKNG